ncbi:MAG: hypothetical protein E3J43_06645 [Candidatus Heimdallarchaeota archaeon]|nr:MAG: hypothetical protein E3J43_06645 [Candidatus Heimdallarchaeota archaeon]
MSLWFEIVIIGLSVMLFLWLLSMRKVQQRILDYSEAQYKQSRALTKWFMTSGLIDLAKEFFKLGRKLKEMRKRDSEN